MKCNYIGEYGLKHLYKKYIVNADKQKDSPIHIGSGSSEVLSILSLQDTVSYNLNAELNAFKFYN